MYIERERKQKKENIYYGVEASGLKGDIPHTLLLHNHA